ncbi:MAG: carbohydrate ABC transporter permease [Hyphomicrobiales bacterium]
MSLLLLVTLYPLGLVIWMSLHRTHLYEVRQFVGLGNYTELLTSIEFWWISLTSILYVAGSLVLVLPVGLASAMAFNQLGRAAPAFRVAGLLPWTLSMAVVGSMWIWILNPTFGPLTTYLKSLGLPTGLMLGDPSLALLLVILVTVWWSFPYAMVMLSAALQSVPGDLYEAVEIDGGSSLAKFRFVTLPHVVPTIGSTALNLGILYLTLVTLIILLTGGGPLGATTTWSFQIFRETVQASNIAPAAAMSVVVLIINLVLGAAYVRLTGRITA